jgi:hypothetical protein
MMPIDYMGELTAVERRVVDSWRVSNPTEWGRPLGAHELVYDDLKMAVVLHRLLMRMNVAPRVQSIPAPVLEAHLESVCTVVREVGSALDSI